MSEAMKRPRVDPGALELSNFGRTWSTFQYRTEHSLDDVLTEGYFDAGLETGLRVGDVVEVMAGAPKTGLSGVARVGELPPVTFAKLVLKQIRPAHESARVVMTSLWEKGTAL